MRDASAVENLDNLAGNHGSLAITSHNAFHAAFPANFKQGGRNVNALVNRTWLAVGFVFCVSCASSVRGQAPRPPQPGDGAVRVIDINKIFKNHAAFIKQLGEFRQHVTEVEADLKSKRQTIEGLQKQLDELKRGADRFREFPRQNEIERNQKALEQELSAAKGEFNEEATSKRKELLEREAKIYFKTYREIQSEVKKYCHRNKVSVVIRYNSEAVDPNDRKSVMRAVANPIVIQRNINITDVILKLLNGRGGEKPPGDDGSE